MNCTIEQISADDAEELCRQITADLPDYFGLPECNEQYIQGVRSRINFAAKKKGAFAGLLSLEFPYPTNSNIYWMAVLRHWQGKGIGQRLLEAAVQYARLHGVCTMTVETLAPSEADENYLKTYQFYEKQGFSSLFNLKPADYVWNMVYMAKNLNVIASGSSLQWIDLTHTLEPSIPCWDKSCGFENTIQLDYSDCTDAVKFRVQHIAMDAGIGTHIDAPAHSTPGGLTIDQLSLTDLQANCVVIDVSDKAHERYSLLISDIEQFELEYGKIPPSSFVLIRTGWDKFWTQPEKYHNNHVFPSVSLAAAKCLLDRQIVGLGIDTLSPDRPENGYPVHALLLGAGKYIIENVANAALLPPCGSRILVFPIKIKGGTEAPVRLISFV
jgi:kynurenine formamidase/GNAT superfamily N-acetyltransferase